MIDTIIDPTPIDESERLWNEQFETWQKDDVIKAYMKLVYSVYKTKVHPAFYATDKDGNYGEVVVFKDNEQPKTVKIELNSSPESTTVQPQVSVGEKKDQ